ncbi:cellulase family glycosylhydrolase [Novosphingobium sp. M1R2S20]|uniref:Cellulase family glycosylhydrolase n=1 Tax=Novosphingobium rhizovicinum TaxID=3228928 RepID=A0ABV3RAY5_9SPHN
MIRVLAVVVLFASMGVYAMTKAPSDQSHASVRALRTLQHEQRNGTSLSNSVNGYYEDVRRVVAPYVLDGGVRALRIPIRRKHLWQNGEIQNVIQHNGWPTKQWLALKPIIDFSLAKDVAVVIDDHTYSAYGHPDLLPFWVALGTKLKETYGDNDLIHLELQNESSRGGWEAGYATNARNLIHGIRAAGITYPVILGWGGWNSIGGYERALAEIDAIGGVGALDPLGKVEFSAHHYPTTTGNDQARGDRSAPQIKGTAVSPKFKAAFDEFKRRGLRIWITEIGMGGGARGWLANGSGDPAFDGRAWFKEFTALVGDYPSTVAGVLAWGGGSAWPDTYPFKVEYGKGQWEATKDTDLWRSMIGFWKGE